MSPCISLPVTFFRFGFTNSVFHKAESQVAGHDVDGMLTKLFKDWVRAANLDFISNFDFTGSEIPVVR